jgi:replication factor A1
LILRWRKFILLNWFYLKEINNKFQYKISLETKARIYIDSKINYKQFHFQFQVKIMAEAKPGLRKPTFTKVEQLQPGTSGHTLTVKVVNTKMVMQKGRPNGPQPRQMRIAESLVGDETGMIIFTARNDQVDLLKDGSTIILRNAKIDMFKGSMRLAVDKWGRVEVTDPTDITVKEDNNLSLIEYELVNVVA